MKSTINNVTSKDGTRIGFDRLGQGPAVVLVSGGSVDRQSNAPLAQELAKEFTVLNYDRRGRGDSGDTQPYAIEREIEDIEAVIDAAGGSTFLYGTSSGAALAFEAARRLGPKVTKLAMWEPPYIPEGQRRPPADTVQRFERLVAEGRRGDAAEFFMTGVVGMPADFAAFAKTQPWWAAQEALAHTLAYDARIMGDYLPPVDRARTLQTPAIVLVGGASFPAIREGGTLFAKALPNGQTKTLEGQEHNVAPEAIAPELKEFFTGASA